MSGAIIFDLDATLVDSQSVAIESFKDAYVACRLEGSPPAEAFMALSGTPLEEVCTILRLPVSFPDEFRAASRRRQDQLTLFSGISGLLQSLYASGIPLGIITGKDRTRTFETLEALRIASYFRCVVTPDDPPTPKPSPAGVWWICETVECNPSESVVVGDSILDVRAGRAAGAISVGCTWGVARREDFIGEGADFVAESVEDLAQFLYGKVHAQLISQRTPSLDILPEEAV